MGLRVSDRGVKSDDLSLILLQMAYWFGFAAVAGAFGGLIAFGVQHIHSFVSNWRLLFIIEVRSPDVFEQI